MLRRRAIAGPPVRSSAQAWNAAVALLGSTLRPGQDHTSDIDAALAALSGLGPALVAAGRLTTPMTLRGGPLDIELLVLIGEPALDLAENLNPVPGGAGVADDWTLYLPTAGALDAAVRAATSGSAHLSCGTPPAIEAGHAADALTQGARPGRIDPAALAALRETP